MASTSDLSAAGGGGEERSMAAASVSEGPSSSSKRRWSPCTWRYAIEEVQPDLGSRPRSALSVLPSSSKSRPFHAQDHTIYAQNAEQAPRHGAYAGRAADLSEVRSRHTPSRGVLDMPVRKKAPPFPQRPHPQSQEPGEEDDDESRDGRGDHDAELIHRSVGSKKRKQRGMSPSELYFCEICRGKAAEALKHSSSPDSPLP